MTPKEKLQKKIDDKRLELGRAVDRVEVLTGEVRMLQETMAEVFGISKRMGGSPGGRPTNEQWQAEQDKLLAAMDGAPPEGVTVRQIGEKLYDKFDETIRSRITQRISRGIEKGTMERVSEGHFRIKRASVHPISQL